MSDERAESRDHTFTMVNDEWKVEVSAHVDDPTWHRITQSLTQTLVAPTAIISMPGKLNAKEAEALWKTWRERFA